MSRPRRELRNILGYFRLGSSDESKPIQAPTKHFPDHGAISKMEDSIRDSKSLTGIYQPESELEDEKLTTKMSPLRKFSFVMSFSPCVMYFAVLLYFIPCRQPTCTEQKEWRVEVEGVMTSNIGILETSGVPTSVIFGSSDNYGSGSLVSLAISSGKLNWVRSSESIYQHVFCNFDQQLQFDSVSGCIVTAYNMIAAVSSSNGKIHWFTNLTQSIDGETIHKVYIARTPTNKLLIFGLSDLYLFVLDARSGVLKSVSELPCSWTLNKKLSGPWMAKNETHWLLMCEYGDNMEIWTFLGKEVFSTSPYHNGTKNVHFDMLFSRPNLFGSIDLTGDVTRVRESDFVLSWANGVVMATLQAPLRTTWERRFPNLITNAVVGHFTKTNDEQIALAVKSGAQSTQLHILELNNGSSVHVTHLNTMNVMSLKKVSGLDNQTDVLVVETSNPIDPPSMLNSTSSTGSATPKSYFSVQYNGSSFVYQHLVSADVYATTLSSFHDGVADLVLSTNTPTGHSWVQRTFVRSLVNIENSCGMQAIANASTVFLLD